LIIWKGSCVFRFEFFILDFRCVFILGGLIFLDYLFFLILSFLIYSKNPFFSLSIKII